MPGVFHCIRSCGIPMLYSAVSSGVRSDDAAALRTPTRHGAAGARPLGECERKAIVNLTEREPVLNDLWISMPSRNTLFALMEETPYRSTRNVAISTFVWATAGRRLKLRTILERFASCVEMARNDMPGGTDPASYVPDWIDKLVQEPCLRDKAKRYWRSINEAGPKATTS